MVPSWKDRWWHSLPWIDGHLWSHPSHPAYIEYPCPHQGYLCVPRSSLQVRLPIKFKCESAVLIVFRFGFVLCSGLTALATYFLTKELWSSGAGLLAACFIAIVPGYISRSVAGSYDNEGIAIFALMFTYFLWVKSVKTGSIFWATLTALSYFYMVNPPAQLFLLIPFIY